MDITDQDTKFKDYDLQIAKSSGTSFSMAHKMGLVKMTMGTATVVNTITYVGNTSTEKYRSSTTTSTTSLAVFDNFKPLTSSNTYYLIVRPSTEYTLRSGYKVTMTSGDPVYQWSQSVTNSEIIAGKYKACAPTPAFRNFARLYSYTGTYQVFAPPVSGKYYLQVWGARGGFQHQYHSFPGDYYEGAGGAGGYTYGTTSFSPSDNVYVVIGGQGEDNIASDNEATFYAEQKAYKYSPVHKGGYNGGGDSGASYQCTAYGCNCTGAGGGGATHIAKGSFFRGVLKEYKNYTSELLVVAGGGGGDAWHVCAEDVPPGYGGGASGGSTKNIAQTVTAAGGTSSSGYSFGLGQNGHSKTQTGSNGQEGCGGGGGGYYGGYSPISNGSFSNAGGAGGSGYVNTSLVSGSTVAGNVANTIPKPYTNSSTYNMNTYETGHYDSGHARITCTPYD